MNVATWRFTTEFQPSFDYLLCRIRLILPTRYRLGTIPITYPTLYYVLALYWIINIFNCLIQKTKNNIFNCWPVGLEAIFKQYFFFFFFLLAIYVWIMRRCGRKNGEKKKTLYLIVPTTHFGLKISFSFTILW